MRFLIGLAAATYVVSAIPALVWFFLFLLGVALLCALLWWWPVLLVLAIIYGTWRLARWAENRERARARGGFIR